MEKSVVHLLREAAAALEERSPSQTPDRPVTVSAAGTPARHGESGTRAEVLRLFRPYNRPQTAPRLMPKTTKKTFTHRFFCLANRRQEVVPGTAEKYELEKAGLGERRLTFSDKFCTATEFTNMLLSHYPALHDCGGYQLLRIRGSSRSRTLAVIDCPSNGYTPHYLCTSANIGQAIIYVRPLQKDISLQNLTQTQEDESLTQYMVTCMYCGQNFMMNHIQDHVDVCETISGHCVILNLHPSSISGHCFILTLHPSSISGHCFILTLHPSRIAGHCFILTLHPSSISGHCFIFTLHPSSISGHCFILTLHPSSISGHCFILTLHPSSISGHCFIFTLHPSSISGHCFILTLHPSSISGYCFFHTF
nr:uncharacterized protein LOC111840491 [Paramormyrops kingsleyae]